MTLSVLIESLSSDYIRRVVVVDEKESFRETRTKSKESHTVWKLQIQSESRAKNVQEVLTLTLTS